MKRAARLVQIFVISGLFVTPVFSSSGFYLASDHPDVAAHHVKYKTELDNLAVSEAGYIKSGADHYVLGWPLHTGMPLDPMNWQMNLGLAKLVESHRPVMPTTNISMTFSLPQNDEINSKYSHLWQLITPEGEINDVVTHFTKIAEQSWSVYFSCATASVIHHEYAGGYVIDVMNVYTFNFMPEGSLMDIIAPTGAPVAPLNLVFSMETYQNGILHHMNQMVMVDFGPRHMPPEDPMGTSIIGNAFVLRHKSQDGIALKEVMGGHVDKHGILHTSYSDGSDEPSYQLAKLKLISGGNPGFEPDNLDDIEIQVLNDALAQ